MANEKQMKHGHIAEPQRSAVALAVRSLSKKYGDQMVLNRLDLDLPATSLVGLLGPNGAGKTTLIKLLAGLITPDSGLIQIAGYDLRRQEVLARSNLAYVADVPELYPELTVYEHLELIARAHKTTATFAADAQMLLDRFGLWEARNNPTFALSRGMEQKLAICCAFIRPSQVILMDEPGGSLDIGSLDELYTFLREYREAGGLAVLSSHQWETLQDLCDKFVLLRPGLVVAGSLPQLQEEAGLSHDASLRDIYLAFISSGRMRHPNGHVGESGTGISAHME